ncbi:MAG: hypothetical protein BroJett001_15400 [Chloroflexota bacterium]|nr:MAG: hypothetical protein BroJett001_15400 [Chloroflexota bacterium]
MPPGYVILQAMGDALPGMTGFDGGGWSRNASREAPISLTQRNPSSANRTSYAAMPLAA